MSDALLVRNILVWSFQAAVLIGAGILASRLFGWRHPHSRLRFFQVLLGTSLLLPLWQPWRSQLPQSAESGNVTVQVVSTATGAQLGPLISWDTILLLAFATGIVLRLGFLGLGVARLRSLRRAGHAVAVEGVTGIEVREVEGLNGPAAFGWWQPVILLPAGMVNGAVKDVALQHELQHVLRRDWLENMLERAAASIFWFHPAVWWLLERIHLTREQAVDAEVAGAGEERDRYLQSLLASAGLANLPAMPAISFIRRPRHLVERVEFLTKETKMSIRTTAASAVLATLMSGVALTVASSYLPLLSAQENTGSPLHWIRTNRQAEGTVQLEVTVGSSGEVLDARVVSGPDELRSQALQSALTWRHTKDAAARRVLPVTIDFKKATSPIGGIAGGIIGGVPASPAPPLPPSIDQAVFEGVDYQGLSTNLQSAVVGVMGALQSGQRMTNAQLDQLRANLAAIDPSLRIGVAMRKGSGDQDVKLRLQVSNQQAAPPQQIRVGGQVQAANLIHQVNPEYPALAREARIQGLVRFNVSIGKEGLVENLRVESGHPLLIQSAMEAVRQWKYRPTFLNGLPVAVQTVVDVNFTLSL